MSRRSLSKPLALALVVGLFLLSGGCDQDPTVATITGGGTEGPQRGGTVVIGLGTDLGGLNELTIHTTATNDHILDNLFLHLLQEHPDFQEHPPTFAPRLARSYEWSEDHRVLTLHLREDAFWTDGVAVTAEDVRFTWQAQTSPEVAWEAAYMKESISDVEVVSPYRVRFHFTHVYPAQLVHLNEGVILPRHVWGQLPFSEWRKNSAWFHDHLVTNGPFILEAWKPEQEIVLVRNDAYYEEGLPYLDRVVMRVVPEQASQMAQLLAGNLDFITNVSPDDAERVQKSPNLVLDEFWGIGFIFIAWNNENPLFSDVRVRQALTLAIDRAGIVEGLWGKYAQTASSPIVDTVWAHDRAIEPWDYNPARARQLLAEAGWEDTDGDGLLDKDGRPFRFEILNHTGNRQREDAAVIAQQQLRQVGIDARPRLLDLGSFVVAVSNGDFEAAVAGMNIGTDVDLRFLLHSDQIGIGMNHSRYRNPEVDRLIELANSQRELVDMEPYLNQIQEIIHREQPITFLWFSKRLNAYNRRIHGAQPNILSPFFKLQEWWVTPAE